MAIRIKVARLARNYNGVIDYLLNDTGSCLGKLRVEVANHLEMQLVNNSPEHKLEKFLLISFGICKTLDFFQGFFKDLDFRRSSLRKSEMKVLLSLLIFSLMALALAKPTEDVDKNESADRSEALKEVVDGNLSGNSNDDADDDDDDDISGVFTGYLPILPAVPMSPMFGGALFQKLQESIQDLQNQLYYMWNQSMNATNLMEMPDNYKNSSSHSQVINGTVVTVNETVYKVVNNGIQSVYHIKEISFRPENDTNVTVQPQLSQQKVTQDTTINPPSTSTAADSTVTTVELTTVKTV